MKKILLSLLLAGFLVPVSAQLCVTLYDGDDFGLPDDYTNIRVLEVAPDDHVWFGMVLNEGEFGGYRVGKFDGVTWTHINDDALFPDPRVTSIAFDLTDSVWIGTQNGLAVIHRSNHAGRRLTTGNGIPDNYITAVAVDSANMVWVGFNDGSVAVFDRSGWTTYNEWSNGPVNTLVIGSDSTVYAGLVGTPGMVSFKNGNWTQYGNLEHIHKITADEFDRLLIASADSLIINTGGVTSIVNTPAGQLIRDVEVKPGGGIWISTVEGLMFRVNNRFRLLSASNSSVPAQLTHPIAFDSDSRLWFAYRYQGTSNALGGTGFLYRELVPSVIDLVSADQPGLTFCFGDSITLSGPADQNTYVWPDGSNEQDYILYDSATVPVAVEGDNKCYYYDTVRVNVQKVYEEEEVCVVTVGEISGRNLIVWERTREVGTASYNVYRELAIRDSFEFLANLSYDALSVFTDPDVDPKEKAVRYKITAVDTCGNESGLSTYHQTLHLSVNKGAQPDEVNLDWNHYEGVDFDSYIIYKGPAPDQLIQVDVHSAGLPTQWTDQNVTDTMYYRVGVELKGLCDPTLTGKKEGTGPYSHALSNLDDNRQQLGTGILRVSAGELLAWPNPMEESSLIGFDNPQQSVWKLSVYNLSGRLIHSLEGIRSNEVRLHREDLGSGCFLFELSGEQVYRGKIIVK